MDKKKGVDIDVSISYSWIKDASPESWRHLDLLGSHTQPNLTSGCPSETLITMCQKRTSQQDLQRKLIVGAGAVKV